jgi:ElaA protein
MSEVLAATLHRSWAADLDPRTLYEILRLRIDVFVVEQACPYDELDGRDLEPGARHFWLGGHARTDPGPDPEPVLGCLRLLDEPGGDLRIGRLCSARSSRARGLGRQLMRAALAEVGDRTCVLDSQEHLAGFYQGFGFEVTGRAYDWDGVPHVPMRRGAR